MQLLQNEIDTRNEGTSIDERDSSLMHSDVKGALCHLERAQSNASPTPQSSKSCQAGTSP